MPRGQARTDVPKISKHKTRSEAYLKYQRYIRSKEFEVVRQMVFERDGRRCACCGWSPDEYDPEKKSLKRTLTIHHVRYDHIGEGGELEAADCIVLDQVCHKAIHSAPSNIGRFKKPE